MKKKATNKTIEEYDGSSVDNATQLSAEENFKRSGLDISADNVQSRTSLLSNNLMPTYEKYRNREDL